VHGALQWKQSRCGDGRTLEMVLVGCMRSLGLRFIFEVDGWNQPCITVKVLASLWIYGQLLREVHEESQWLG
jgi:hypothetical protein